MTMTRSEVYAAINSERDYQDMRQQRDQGQPTHSVADFLLFMEDYLVEARSVASRTWGPTADPLTMTVVRKVVSLGVACAEQHGMAQREGFPVVPLEVQVKKVEDALVEAKFSFQPGETVMEAAARFVAMHNVNQAAKTSST